MSGIQYQLGPISKVKPPAFNCLARPPGCEFFSITVTSQPAFAKKQAAERPANPLPIITSFFLFTFRKYQERSIWTFNNFLAK